MTAQGRQVPQWLKVAATVGCAVAFSYIAFKALVGLLALGVAGALCLFSFKLGPVLAEYLDNLKIKLIKKQALESPIPTLENQAIRYHNEKDTKEAKLEEIIGKLQTLVDKHDAFVKKYPNDTAEIEKNSKYVNRAKAKVESLKKEFLLLAQNVKLFDKEVEKAADKWDMAMTMQDFDLAGDFNNDPMELIRSRTALGSVESAINKSFASLETSMLEDLSSETPVIEVIPTKLIERVPAK